ncbi:MAG TPA: phosphotransferase, partial [Acidimicrobiales bacterium]|nr:phosphotransferase [Acidimicrobiales bacterium]
MATERVRPDENAGVSVITQRLTSLVGGRVTGLSRLSGGTSRDTWSFDCDRAGERVGLILQVERPSGLLGQGRIPTEAELLFAAGRAGVPVPSVLQFGDDDGFGAPWMVLQRIDGETIPRKILRDLEFTRARKLMTEQCARAMAAIHHIPIDSVPGLSDSDQLDEFERVLGGFDEPRPALE